MQHFWREHMQFRWLCFERISVSLRRVSSPAPGLGPACAGAPCRLQLGPQAAAPPQLHTVDGQTGRGQRYDSPLGGGATADNNAPSHINALQFRLQGTCSTSNGPLRCALQCEKISTNQSSLINQCHPHLPAAPDQMPPAGAPAGSSLPPAAPALLPGAASRLHTAGTARPEACPAPRRGTCGRAGASVVCIRFPPNSPRPDTVHDLACGASPPALLGKALHRPARLAAATSSWRCCVCRRASSAS